jgi:hypothetical protein
VPLPGRDQNNQVESSIANSKKPSFRTITQERAYLHPILREPCGPQDFSKQVGEFWI